MKLTSFKIENYKSFLDSKEIKFSSGFNVIIGQNNVGKTALLEALSLKFQGKPHKSLLSLPDRWAQPKKESLAEISLSLTGEELGNLFSTTSEFCLPYPQNATDFNKFINNLFVSDEISLTVGLRALESGLPEWYICRWPVIDLQYACEGQGIFSKVTYRPNSPVSKFVIGDKLSVSYALTTDLGILIAHFFRERIYIFKAERLNLGLQSFGAVTILKPDASNLPEVLNTLQGNTARFARFNQFVRQIFPSIYQITVRPKSNGLEIVVWTEDPEKEREDLAIELSESGTGVGQVLAILYVVMTSDFPRTIIIDEPNSFLHPGAARKLIEILSRNFAQHQYIVSTHSAEIINAANPNTLTLIRWEKHQSVLEPLDTQQINDVQKCLVEVGAKLSDVFGADNVLWVEGATEEACFPKILQKIEEFPVLGTSIIAVKNTGDFKGKNKKIILDIYNKVSKGNALLPKAIAFIFDREDMPDEEIEDIKRESKGFVHFLPRRTYENYLIDPLALSAVMSNLETFKNGGVTEEKILQWLNEKGAGDISDKVWLEKVHGAKLLADLFEDLSGCKETYRKTIHSLALTEWLIKNKPNTFDELNRFLMKILEPPDRN